MRIAMVSEHASPLAALGGEDAGGQNLHVAELAAAMGRRGHEVVVYTRRDGLRLPTRVVAGCGVHVVHVPAGPAAPVPKDELPPYMPEFAERLRAMWLAEPPDVVHSHFWMSGTAALAAVEGTGIPVVHTFHALGTVKRRHQGDSDTSPAGRVDEERRIGGAVDEIVATCSDELTELAAMDVPPERVRVIPCGVDVDLFGPDGPTAPRRSRHRVVTVGRLVPRKGFADVIAAMPHLPGAELIVAGGSATGETDAETARLRRVARDLGVADRVTLPGPVDRADMPALLRSADVVVCAPWYEPFGIVPLEAMACGRPVVASAVGGLLDTVSDGVTGLHVPPRDPEAVAAAVAELLHDPDRADKYGDAARRRAVEGYTWDGVAERTLAVYADVLAARTARPRQAAR
ncbi:glycosyltransferase involved in cell wall biosynthesis [Stackebrandtia albiflava]|uniref:Glycosyltransferase involved in cell wall biosynthesis n=1 Tax=Stackebrandtia albiflava TaxID=406432 RepID=A0A562VA21_9ACTN|nr:glycosyltransferase [Stackebrandtia albiflava]TWJ14715.1 glycosyltransferase involved in cell wall biosynthesis [Stackebrandtia albiflava]